MKSTSGIVLIVTAIALFSNTALSYAEEQKSQLNAQDEQFIKEAVEGNLSEVMIGHVAATQAQDKNTKEFAERIVVDHTAAFKRLMKLADKLDMRPSKRMNQQHMQTIKQLSRKPTTSLDKTYINVGIREHKELISVFQQEVKQGQNERVVKFAKQTLSMLKAHLRMAQRLDSNGV